MIIAPILTRSNAARGTGFMQDEQARLSTSPQQAAARQDSIQADSSTPSDANSILDIELQANQLFDYIDKLSSFADKACQNAINQTEWAQRSEENHQTELINLRRQLEQSNVALHERNIAYAVLEETTKAQRTELEKRLSEKQTQLSQREEELKILTTEIASFIRHQQNQVEPLPHLGVEPLNQEIAALKLDLVKRDEIIQAKNNALRKIENDFRSRIQELEQTVRANAISMEQQEAALKQKEALIQATAMKELEVGKLIKRLSTECEKLNAELHDKNRRLAQLEGAKSQPASEVKAWRQVVRRMQEEPT
jgi:DNA repair exonuclease SbcCD ATPase subunit